MALPMLNNEELEMDVGTTRMVAADVSYSNSHGRVGELALASLEDSISPRPAGAAQEQGTGVIVT